MPATMGMMMLGRLIMYSVGDHDSWDQALADDGHDGWHGRHGRWYGRWHGRHGRRMGGMGGGMAGRRFLRPALPVCRPEAGQTRHLPTRLVASPSLDPDGRRCLVPEKGEKLKIGDIAQTKRRPRSRRRSSGSPRTRPPPTISQLVMWNAACRLEWETIAELSKKIR